MALALDGSSSSTATSANRALTLTTTNANDIIFAVASGNGKLSAVSGASLTWVMRSQAAGSNNLNVTTFWALAPSILTSATLTLTWSASTFMSCWVFGVSGANSSSPFDPNGGLPVQDINVASGTYSTTNANDLVIAANSCNYSATPAVPTGFTAIAGPNTSYFGQCCYQILSSPQSGTTVSWPSANTGNSFIIDAVTQASSMIGHMSILMV